MSGLSGASKVGCPGSVPQHRVTKLSGICVPYKNLRK